MLENGGWTYEHRAVDLTSPARGRILRARLARAGATARYRSANAGCAAALVLGVPRYCRDSRRHRADTARPDADSAVARRVGGYRDHDRDGVGDDLAHRAKRDELRSHHVHAA